MLKILPVFSALLLAVPSRAAQTIESARASAAASFSALPGFKSLPPASLGPVHGVPPPPLRSASQYVRVSGDVRLDGSGYLPKGSRFVSVNLSGPTDIRDSSGRVRSGYTTVYYTASLFVNGSWVSDWARPSVYVSLYREGRYIGQAHVDGTIHVSGYVSGDWVHVSGSGTLSGDVWVRDP